MNFPGTCIVCNEEIAVDEIGWWAKGLGVKHIECAIKNDSTTSEVNVLAVTVPVNFTLIPKNTGFKIIKNKEKIQEIQSKMEQYLIENSKTGKIRLTKEDKSTFHNDLDFPIVNAFLNSKHDVWWSNGISENIPFNQKIFKNLFGVHEPNWRPTKKNSYPVVSINLNKDGSQRTAGIILQSDDDYFLGMDERIDGNYDTHINGLSLHKKKDVIQNFFRKNNHSIKILGSDKPIFIISKLDENFAYTISEFVKNIKKIKDCFLKNDSKDIKIQMFDVNNQKYVDNTLSKYMQTEISTFDLDLEYEKTSNELISKFALDQDNEQKLEEFESDDFMPKKQQIQSSVSYRNPEIASRMKIKHNHTCQICKIPTFKDKTGNFYTESHHIIPRSLGGPDKPSNILIVCANCHRKFDSGDDDTLFETYTKLMQKELISNFDTLKQFNAISDNLFNKLTQLN